MHKLALLILIILCCLAGPVSAQDTISAPNPNGTTKVYIKLIVNMVSSIDAANQTVKAEVFLSATWNDPRLVRPDQGRKIVSLEKIWDPWLSISNKLNVRKDFPDVATVLSDGTVIYMQSLYGDFIQNFTFYEFPFDKQEFSINLTAVGLSANEVELIYDQKASLLKDLNLTDWKVLNYKVDTEPYTYPGETTSVPSIKLVYEIQRQSGYYLLLFVIPLVLIIMMSWNAFWLDPSLSSSQVSIATTSMLTLIAYRFVVVGNLPKISYMTKMDVFILGSSILIFLTLLESSVTASLHAKGKKEIAAKMDRTSRWLFPIFYLLVAVLAYFY